MERTIELIPGLPPEEVKRRCFLHHRDSDASWRTLAYYLMDMDRRGLQGPGFRSVAQWAFAKLQISEKQAQRLISVARGYSGEAEQPFRVKPNTHSGRSRTVVPVEAGQRSGARRWPRFIYREPR